MRIWNFRPAKANGHNLVPRRRSEGLERGPLNAPPAKEFSMPPTEIAGFPEAPPDAQLPPDIRNAVATYRFDLKDGRAFTLTLDHGRPVLEERDSESPDCVVKCSKEEFTRLMTGKLNLLTALMRGDIRVSGNLASAKDLYRYLHLTSPKGEHA